MDDVSRKSTLIRWFNFHLLLPFRLGYTIRCDFKVLVVEFMQSVNKNIQCELSDDLVDCVVVSCVRNEIRFKWSCRFRFNFCLLYHSVWVDNRNRLGSSTASNDKFSPLWIHSLWIYFFLHFFFRSWLFKRMLTRYAPRVSDRPKAENNIFEWFNKTESGISCVRKEK